MQISLPFLLLSLLGIWADDEKAENEKTKKKSCQFGGQTKADGTFWTHWGQFNVSCVNGRVKVLNCVTEQGTRLPLGTRLHVEAGIRYSCQLNYRHEQLQMSNMTTSAPSPEAELVPECEQQNAEDDDEYIRDGFAASCGRNHTIIGCLDGQGNLAKSGHFYTLARGQLRRCVLYGRGRWAKSERKGCFNGTVEDDPDDTKFHVKVGRIWQNDAFMLRCGEEGLHVYKCLVDGNRIHTGTAWIDRENVLNVCK